MHIRWQLQWSLTDSGRGTSDDMARRLDRVPLLMTSFLRTSTYT